MMIMFAPSCTGFETKAKRGSTRTDTKSIKMCQCDSRRPPLTTAGRRRPTSSHPLVPASRKQHRPTTFALHANPLPATLAAAYLRDHEGGVGAPQVTVPEEGVGLQSGFGRISIPPVFQFTTLGLFTPCAPPDPTADPSTL